MDQQNITSEPQAATPAAISHTTAANTGNIELALNYLLVGLPGFFGTHKHDPGVRYHSNQALFTFVTFLAAHTLLGVFLLLRETADVAAFGFSLFQVFRAYQGNPIHIPRISAMARKQAEPSCTVNQTLQ